VTGIKLELRCAVPPGISQLTRLACEYDAGPGGALALRAIQSGPQKNQIAGQVRIDRTEGDLGLHSNGGGGGLLEVAHQDGVAERLRELEDSVHQFMVQGGPREQLLRGLGRFAGLGFSSSQRWLAWRRWPSRAKLCSTSASQGRSPWPSAGRARSAASQASCAKS